MISVSFAPATSDIPLAGGLTVFGDEPQAAKPGDMPVDSETASFADHLQSLLPNSESPEELPEATEEDAASALATAGPKPSPAGAPVVGLLFQMVSRPFAFLRLEIPVPPGVAAPAETATAAPAQESTLAPPVDEPVASLPVQTPPPAPVATCVTGPSDPVFAIPVQARAPQPPEGEGTQELAGSSLPPGDADAEMGSTKRISPPPHARPDGRMDDRDPGPAPVSDGNGHKEPIVGGPAIPAGTSYSPPPAPQSKAPDLPKDEEPGGRAAEVVAWQAGSSMAMPPRGQGAEPTRSEAPAKAPAVAPPVGRPSTTDSRTAEAPSPEEPASSADVQELQDVIEAQASSEIASPERPAERQSPDIWQSIVSMEAPPRGLGAATARSDVSARAATETAPVNHAGTAGSRAGADPSAKRPAGAFGGAVNENTARQATASSGIAFAARVVEHQPTVNPLAQQPPALPDQVQPVPPPALRPGADSSQPSIFTGAVERLEPPAKPQPQGPAIPPSWGPVAEARGMKGASASRSWVLSPERQRAVWPLRPEIAELNEPIRTGAGQAHSDDELPSASPASEQDDSARTDARSLLPPAGEPQARGPSPHPVTGAASVPAPPEAHAPTAAGGAAGSSLQPAVRENPRASEFVRQAGATAEVPTVGTVPAKTGPVRDLVLSVNGPAPEGESATAVSLRVVERQGEIHFSVRAQDEQLKQSLRTHLEQLVEGLDRQGFQAETWHPIQAAPPARDLARGREDPSSGQDAQSGGHRDPAGESGSGRHGRRDGSPLWLEELEGQMQF